ncbi:hypothetical protein AQ857_00795 [Burkholderia pseudomallei]|nr:hypothetical protein AQ857_00795 [Burkholderia pseudomallei]OMZ18043.1 hypothetical protein AQ858_30660 [Burkholderia pseudomallei]
MNGPPRAAQRLFELGTCCSISERSGAGPATRAAALAARHGTARRGNVETRGDDQFIASARFRRSTRAAPVPNARHAARPRCNAPRHSWQARCVAS